MVAWSLWPLHICYVTGDTAEHQAEEGSLSAGSGCCRMWAAPKVLRVLCVSLFPGHEDLGAAGGRTQVQ